MFSPLGYNSFPHPWSILVCGQVVSVYAMLSSLPNTHSLGQVKHFGSKNVRCAVSGGSMIESWRRVQNSEFSYIQEFGSV